jgi:hypothetical protein
LAKFDYRQPLCVFTTQGAVQFSILAERWLCADKGARLRRRPLYKVAVVETGKRCLSV